LPRMVIELIAEKVVQWIIGLLFPAAGAAALFMELVRGIKAAWGAISRIIAAIQKFVAFLKAVKVGSAPGLFASALAAGAVALIDIIANYLLERMKGAAKGSGDALRKLGEKLMKVLGKAAKAVIKVVKKVAKAVVRYAKAGARLAGRGARAVGRGIARVGRYVANSRVGRYIANSPLGRAAKSIYDKGRKGFDKLRDKIRKRRKARAKSAQERLDKAVAAFQPQLQRLLSRGTSGFYLWAQLRFWQVRYLLRSLRMQPDGRFVARVNPYTVLDAPRGKRVSDTDLGRLLAPVFGAAEQDYTAFLMSHPVAGPAIEDAARRREAGDPGSLSGLTRFEQQVVLNTSVPPVGKRGVETSVAVYVPRRGTRGKVENINTYGPNPRAGREGRSPRATDVGLRKFISLRARTHGVTNDEVAGILTSRTNTIDLKVNSLAGRLASAGRTQAERRESVAFLNTLRRTAFLTQSFEAARAPGIPTATAVSSVLLAGGRTGLPEVLDPRGNMAPMTPVGAAPESGSAETPTQHQAERLRHRRVGRIFAELLATASRRGVIATEGGYDLNDLAEAIRLWLEQRLSKVPDPEQLAASEALLRAEIVALLSSYHGR
jgi:hypothetical protein